MPGLAFRFKAFSARVQSALGRIFWNPAAMRPRGRLLAHHLTPAAVEQLEPRLLLSAADIYPNLVPTVGVYDENGIQTNTVDTVATGSSMTDVEFASRLATAWANNDGGVIDGTGHSDVFGFGQGVEYPLFIAPMDETGWINATPTDRQAISGTTAFATTFSPAYGGYHVLSQWFGVETSDPNRQVLEFGLTVLGQTLQEYGTVHVFGHLRYGEDMEITHQVLSGQAEDVFYGLKAPRADYFTGFSVAYIPEGEWIVDHPLWFDDFGFITGDYTATGNTPPTAVDDAYFLPENSTLTVNASWNSPGNGVLANDSDPESHDLHAVLVSGPSHGTLTWKLGGGFTYTPDADFIGTDSFTYNAVDSLGASSMATVTLTVTALPDPPIAADDAYTLNENETLIVASPGVMANDETPDGSTWQAILVSGPSHLNTFGFSSNGGFNYTPSANFHGVDSFTYRLSNGTTFSDVVTVTLTVNEANDPPVAAADSYELEQNDSLTISSPGVLANDSDQNGDAMTALLVAGPSQGTLLLQQDGSFTYTPNLDFAGTDTFTYRASDGMDLSNPVTVTLNVLFANVAPVGAADSYEFNENTTLNVGGPGVLVNDSDPEGTPLTAELVSGPTHGALSFNADGSFSYTPLANFHGPVTFQYRAFDGEDYSAPITVTLNILSMNVAPIAHDDSFTVGEDETLVLPITPTAHLTMVSEPGDWIGQGQTYDLDQTDGTFTAVRNFDNGVRIRYSGAIGDWWTLEFAAPGEVPLTAGVYTGATRFPFQSPNAPGLSVSGQGRGSNMLTGEFTVHEVIYGPGGEVLVFEASFEQHREGLEPALIGHVRFVAAGTGGVLANDSDADGDPLSATLLSGPSHGTLTLNADGRLEYTPDANFHGTDTFTYRAGDGAVLSEPATVTIVVLPANDAPIASAQSVSTDEDSLISGSATATDVDGDALQFALADGPANGTLVFNTDGSFTYTPDLNFHGSDSFTFVAHDGDIASQPASVTISVSPINDVPVANGQALVTAEDVTVSGSVTGVDIEGDALQFSLAGGPAHGTLVLSTDGTFTYTPDLNFHGSDSFTFIAHDGTVSSEAGTVTMTVNPVNDAPTLSEATFVMAENSGVGTTAGSVTGADVDGDPLTYQIVSDNSSGAFAIDAATGAIRVANSLPLDFETAPEFILTVQVADAAGLFATATVIVTLSDVDETLVLTIDVLPGDSTNTISSSGNGRKEVAILSTAAFDVHDLDIATLRFGRTGTENSLKWKNGQPEYRYEDVNDDGLLDVIVLFERDLMGFLAGDAEAHLTGQTLDGTDVAGSDDVNLVGNWPG